MSKFIPFYYINPEEYPWCVVKHWAYREIHKYELDFLIVPTIGDTYVLEEARHDLVLARTSRILLWKAVYSCNSQNVLDELRLIVEHVKIPAEVHGPKPVYLEWVE